MVDYSRPDWTSRVREATGGVHIVYDTIGGAITEACLDVLAPGGELIFGALGRFALGQSHLEQMIFRNQSLRGFAVLPLLTPRAFSALAIPRRLVTPDAWIVLTTGRVTSAKVSASRSCASRPIAAAMPQEVPR